MNCRELVHDIFLMQGLQDVHNFFFKELDSWDVWSVDEDNRKKELNAMARRGLEKWMTLFKVSLRSEELSVLVSHSFSLCAFPNIWTIAWLNQRISFRGTEGNTWIDDFKKWTSQQNKEAKHLTTVRSEWTEIVAKD